MPDMEKLAGRVIGENNTLQLRGRTGSGKEIWIPELRVEKYTTFNPRDVESPRQVLWEGIAQLFVEGDLAEFDADEGGIICAILTSPTPVALSFVSYVSHEDGTIDMWEGDERKRIPIRWHTSLGDAEFIDTYFDHRGEQAGPNPATVRIRRCQITTRARLAGRVSFAKLIDDLRAEFEDALLLLSFLGRSRVVWYEVQVAFFPDSSKDFHRAYRSATARRDQWLGFRERREDLQSPVVDTLVRHESLREGVFQQLLAGYEASPHRDTIRRAIVHLLASHERSYLENRYVSAFTAMECLVFGLGRGTDVTTLLSASHYRKLAHRIRQLIRDDMPDVQVAQDVIKKIPELRRRAFADQVLRLTTSDLLKQLWPPDTDNVEEQMRQIITRRNVYMHQGRINDSHILYN